MSLYLNFQIYVLSFCNILILLNSICVTQTHSQIVEATEFLSSGHTNNWAVLVDTSRFWFNYRHEANTLSIYRSIKRLGIPDSHIILMIADDMACNPRNPRPATIFNNKNQNIDVYGDDVEVDYRGYEVTAESFFRLLTGAVPDGTPRSKQLLTDERSNILFYLTGHGGDGFLKFQDMEDISGIEIADAFQQMWVKRRYNEILFVIETCQAASMYREFRSPNMIGFSSSRVGEDSLSHHSDNTIGVYVIDRFAYFVLEFLETVSPTSRRTLADLFRACPQSKCSSHTGVRNDLFLRDPSRVLITDFFGSVRKVNPTPAVTTTTTPVSSETRIDTEMESEAGSKQKGGTGLYQLAPQFPSDADLVKYGADRSRDSGGLVYGYMTLIAIAILLTAVTMCQNTDPSQQQ